MGSPHAEFSQSFATLPEITHLTYLFDNHTMKRNILPEYLQYYTCSLLWMRICDLKLKTHQPLSQEEFNLIHYTAGKSFVIPQPILDFLKFTGKVETALLMRLKPKFPPIPTYRIRSVGGFYPPIDETAPVDNENHNLYEEVPALGVMADAICNAISGQPPGRYTSRLSTATYVTSENLLGYRILGYRHNEAKDFAFDSSITTTQFPETIPGTAFNLPFISKISDLLDCFSTFKMLNTTISAIGSGGSQAQTVMQRLSTPVPSGVRNTHSSAKPTSLTRASESDFRASLFYCTQLYKEDATDGPIWARPSPWACVIPTEAHPIPAEWNANKNDRRDLPREYTFERFTGYANDLERYRRLMVHELVSTKR